MNDNINYGAERNVNLLCHYIAYMDGERRVITKNWLGFTSGNKYDGRLAITPDELKSQFESILSHYGYIILVSKRRNSEKMIYENIVSGFMAYKGNAVKLSGEQVKNIIDNVKDIDSIDNGKFVESRCSIPTFAAIKEDVIQDGCVCEREKRFLLV